MIEGPGRAARALERWWAPLLVALLCAAIVTGLWRELRSGEEVRSAVAAALLAAGLCASAAFGASVASLAFARRRARSLRETDAALAEILAQQHTELGPKRTGRQGIEHDVVRRVGELRDAVTELEAFNGSLAHDLRSPLGAIVNLASLLRGTQAGRLDDDGRAFLERIEAAARRALVRMDRLLSLSRIGRHALATEEVDLKAEVRRAFEGVRQRRRPGGIELALQALPRVATDPELLRAALEQLLDNAVKFSSTREKPRIEVGWLRKEGGDVYFVRDNGVGFEPPHGEPWLHRLEHPQGPAQPHGGGIGLAIAARALRRLGGRLWAESAPGHGAVFYFTLKDDGEAHGSLRDAGSAPPR